MGTKTVSLSDDAYERLKRLKKENESFSDVVRRVTGKIKLRDFHGVLKEEAAEELEEIITEGRRKHAEEYGKRMRKTKEKLEG